MIRSGVRRRLGGWPWSIDEVVLYDWEWAILC
jgi:hypothetical protein